MKMQAFELEDAALDFAVADAAGYLSRQGDHWMVQLPYVGPRMNFLPGPKCVFIPSTRWAQGGPIIEQECIQTSCLGTTGYTPNTWTARHPQRFNAKGATPLIAAMRCFVMSKSTDGVVDIPKEFQKERVMTEKGFDGEYTLTHATTGEPVANLPKAFPDFRGNASTLIGGRPPMRPGSTGKVWTDNGGEFFPAVFDLKWVKQD